MLSIGDFIDKLVIENIKIFTLREKLHLEGLSDNDYVTISDKLVTLTENRAIICDLLDEKVNNVVSGKEKNIVLKKIRTYNEHK
jgi:hypothetical protein